MVANETPLVDFEHTVSWVTGPDLNPHHQDQLSLVPRAQPRLLLGILNQPKLIPSFQFSYVVNVWMITEIMNWCEPSLPQQLLGTTLACVLIFHNY